MMYINDGYFAKKLMKYKNRDYYSVEALKAILNFYNEKGTDVEFDPVSICGEWEEINSCNFDKEFEGKLEGYRHHMPTEEIIDLLEGIYSYVVKLDNDNILAKW